jgi:transposase
MNQTDFQKLEMAYNLRGIELDTLRERVTSLEEEVARLKELLKLQQDRLFGKKSEANLGTNEPGIVDPANTDPNTVVTVASHTRKKRGPRTLDTINLPRYSVIHDLPLGQQICNCGNPLHFVRDDISEQLEVIPVRYCIIEHIRKIYGCRSCDTIKMAPKPAAPLPKAIAGPSLLTDIIVNKYQYHLPLYRQSKIMKSYGIDILDKTLTNWVMGCGDGLLPMYDALWIILENPYLQVDESPVKLLETNKNGYMWTYFAPLIGKGLVVFEFSETRKGKVAFNRLKDFKGLLQTDAYTGYGPLREKEGIIGLGCFSHARRKFSEVVKISGDGHGLAAEMLVRMKPLYELEARLKDMNAPHRIRKKLRKKIARSITKEIHKWLLSIKPIVPPKSKLGKAITYTLKQWPYLIKYIQHGMAEIDTNFVENKIRDISLGEKNWLFIGNKESGKIHALFYSLIISAVINALNPRVYIHYLLTKIHDLRLKTIEPITLLPDRVDRKKLQEFATEQIEFGRKILNSS